jgi:hypothetical protein
VEYLFGARLNPCDLCCHERTATIGHDVENTWIDNHVVEFVNGFEILALSKTLEDWAWISLKYVIPQSDLNFHHVFNVCREF